MLNSLNSKMILSVCPSVYLPASILIQLILYNIFSRKN